MRRRGRPRCFDGTVSVRLTKELHDALSLEALMRGVNLAEVIRERLSAFRISKIDNPAHPRTI